MPSRRSGKANSRQSRQKRQQQRSSQRASLQRPMEPTVSADAVSRPAPAPAATTTSAAAPERITKPGSKFENLYGSSRLSEQAHLEYHYVERDLRNIGVLILVMLVLLAVATVAFNLLGIGPR